MRPSQGVLKKIFSPDNKVSAKRELPKKEKPSLFGKALKKG